MDHNSQPLNFHPVEIQNSRVMVLLKNYYGSKGKIVDAYGDLWLIELDTPDKYGHRVLLALLANEFQIITSRR